MKRPTPQELMAYADRELTDADALEVEAWLAAHPEDRAAVDRVKVVGRAVRLAVDERTPSFDISDDVMAAIERRLSAEHTAASPPPPSSVRRLRMVEAPVSGVRAPLPTVAAGRGRGRVVVGLVLAAAAAAAAIGFVVQADHGATGGVASAEHGLPSVPTPAAPENDEEPAPGTTVTSVDFGSRSGMIFYIPNDGDSQPSTTVVWIGEEKK